MKYIQRQSGTIGVQPLSNTVIVSGGSIGWDVYGGYRDSGNTMYNTVSISGGNIVGIVFGGYSYSGNTMYNTVSISGGTIGGSVYGGYSGSGNATHNTVSIFGSPVFGADVQLSGGSGSGAYRRTGNTLNIFTSGIKLKNIENFQHHNFALPIDGSTGLTLTDTNNTDFGNKGSFTSTINLPYATNGNLLKVGEQMTILQSNGTLANLPTLKDGLAQQGYSIAYDYTLNQVSNSLIATINHVRAHPKTKTLSENRAANLGALTAGADLAASSGMANAVASVGQNSGFVPFGVMNAGSMRYNSGSHVDSRGTSLLTGIASKSGSVTRGYFIEGGWSSYDTFNDDNNNGSGHANYYGLGMLVKKQLKHNLYLDVSVRLGQINSAFVNNNFKDINGIAANYHTNSFYYSAHLGLGKTYKLKQNQELDIFARYLFSHQNSNKINLGSDQFNFKAINSNRLQLGTKYTFGKTDNKNYYVGLTYEYEMSSRAKGTVTNYGATFDLPAPSLKGSSGILEIGMQIKPEKDKNYTIDIGLQGYAGKRQGFSGSVSANFKL